MFKVNNNKDTRKTLMVNDVNIIVNFEHLSHPVQVFLLLTLNM